jgi:hypothetical protein
MTTRTFDPGKFAVQFGGNIITGFGDSVCKVVRTENSFTTHVGADGEVARTRNRNRSGTITFTLLRTAPSNDILAAALLADERFGTGIAPVQVVDLLGSTVHFGANAWVEKAPDDDIGKEVGDREWMIAVGDLDTFSGSSFVSAP